MRARSRGHWCARVGMLVAGLMVVAALPGGALPAVESTSAAASPPASTTVTFGYTGAVQTWTVPAGSRAVQVEAWGAQGGVSYHLTGRKGGYAGGTVEVTSGETLRVYVGGRGTSYDSTKSVNALVGGGWNGGGHTRNGDGVMTTGAGGGGASDVRRGGTALTDRVIVAGGGGGSGGGEANDYDLTGSGGGGGGGYFGGGAGGSGGQATNWQVPPQGGRGGTQAAGGAGGAGASSVSGSGTLGKGGNAGSMNGPHAVQEVSAPGWGGAGGGLSGGDGQRGGDELYQSGAGGGGGSSLVSGTDTLTLSEQRSRDGLVKVTYWAVEPPTVPETLFPTEGATWGAMTTQEFVVRSTDPNGDDYVAKVTVVDEDSGDVYQFESLPTASGANATAMATQMLLPGEYRYRAQSCDQPVWPYPAGCSAKTAWVSFTVDAVGGSSAPSAPQVIAPAANSTFDAGERQDFTLRATDPDRDTYTGRITFENMSGDVQEQEVETSEAPSGVPSMGSLVADQLPPGTYEMEATATDRNGVTGPSTKQTIGVASPEVSPCASGGTTLVDGWFGDRYLQLSGVTVDDVGYVCLRTNVSTAPSADPLAGWLRAESGSGVSGGPSVGTTAACPDGGEDSLPFPLLDQGLLGSPDNPTNRLLADLRVTGDTVTACFKVKVNGGNVLDTSVTIQAPEGAELSDLNFVPEDLEDNWAPPQPTAPPAGLPSSECYQAPFGQTLLVNAEVDSQHLWLYQQADGTTWRLCARVQGTASEGVVIRSQGDGSSGTALVTGRPADDPTTPCRTDEYIYYSQSPYIARLHMTELTADPVGVCLYAGLTSSGGVSAWLLLDRTPSVSTVSHGIDP